MGLNWLWSMKCGEVKAVNHNGKEYKLSLYQGNAEMIFVYEYEEDGRNMYTVSSFWSDAEHAKRCLGINKNADKENRNIHDNIKEWTFYKDKMRDMSKIIGWLVKAFDEVTIHIEKSPGEGEENA